MTKTIQDKDGNQVERKWKPWKKKKLPPKETTALITPPEMSDTESSEPHNSLIDDGQLDEARNLLYMSHMFAKFAEIGWQFCVILFLAAIANYNSIIFVSTYGFFCGLMSCLFGSTFGAFIDSKKYDRLHIANFFILCENLSVVTASFSCFLLLNELNPDVDNEINTGDTSGGTASYFSQLFREVVPPLNAKTWILLVAIHIFGGVARLLDEGFTVCIERDWIVVMSKCQDLHVADREYNEVGCGVDENQSATSGLSWSSESSDLTTSRRTRINDNILRDLKEKTWLAQTNTTMRQIDLASKILAPAVAGIYISWFDSKNDSTDIHRGAHLAYAALIVGLLNVLSLFVEYYCAKQIYERIPTLSDRSTHDSAHKIGNMPKINDDECSGTDLSAKITTRGYPRFNCSRGLAIYFDQPISLAGLSLALL